MRAGTPNHIYTRLKDAKDAGEIESMPARGGVEIRHKRVNAGEAVAWALANGIDVPTGLRDLATTPPAPRGGARKFDPHISPMLAALYEAADRFWSPARVTRGDTSTYPKNEAIAEWLRGRDVGFSDDLSNKGASIIRPDWAGKGGRPKEK